MHEPEAVVDEAGARVTRTIEVRAPIGVVWEALTDPRELAAWFGDTATFPDGTGAGASGTFGWSDHGDFPARVERAEPPHVWAFRWGTPGEPLRDDNSTLATFTLEETGSGTRLTVVETGFERLGDAAAVRAALEDNREGWTSELDELVALVARRWTPSAVDPVGGTITRSLDIPAPRALVWQHLTDPASIERWWGHPADFPGGMRAGVTGTFEHEGRRWPIALRIVRPESTLAFRWGDFDEPEPGPTACDVRFDLESLEHGGTRVTVVESGWMRVPAEERDERMQGNAGGWELALDGLRRHVLAAARA
ncbi:SRPBCC domain-containing protein [Agrococcus sp. HG114]|uniref:SRPBCC domain-containing protein n=1 Tax=Agrococcus sp. HG114 TaxID=2969757 RepID=UPI00215ADF13|nr:SRPBCC domain-containing protein [Agrococcus sp. HG114]MCR8671861.1 SRPBCC domain-containing protein [Agrococcus sp. HG114]